MNIMFLQLPGQGLLFNRLLKLFTGAVLGFEFASQTFARSTAAKHRYCSRMYCNPSRL